jgi:hypothetical protein
MSASGWELPLDIKATKVGFGALMSKRIKHGGAPHLDR